MIEYEKHHSSSINYIYKQYDTNLEFGSHFHDSFELIYVFEGEIIVFIEKEKYNLKKIKNVVAGGSERYESVYNGLKEVTGNIVLIHDGARPLINNEIIERSIEGTIKSDACVVGVPVKDTIKRANKEGYIIDTPNRSELWITQTPQSFKTDLVKMAYKKMKEELEKGNTTLNITDDAMVVEEFTTNQVRFVQGDYKNIKVTTPEDIDIAELFIELDAK